MDPVYMTLIAAWGIIIVWVAIIIALNGKQHPKTLFVLFFVELWERFSYYGMRAFLVLYITAPESTGGFGLAEKLGNGIYAAYGALIYLTPLAGGLLADRILGFKKSIIWGAALMAAAQFTLSQSTGQPVILYTGLGLLVLGNGFFKPNMSSLIGKLYEPGDSRRDAGFTIFYMGINVGAFLAPLTCGAVAEKAGWHYGFLLAGIGMVTGLVLFVFTARSGMLEDKAEPPPEAAGRKLGGLPLDTLVYLGSILAVPLLGSLIYQNDVMDYIMSFAGIAIFGFMFFYSFKFGQIDRNRIWVMITLLVFTTVFWTLFELAGSALTLFAKKNVEKSFLGIPLTTSQFQAFNALFIISFAPVFSAMWIFLGKRNMEPSSPLKFAISLILVGAGFLVMKLGTPFVVAGLMPAFFLILLYLFHTWAELSLSPVGLSLFTKLAPVQIASFMMGFWFLATALAHQLGKQVANWTSVEGEVPPEESLNLALSVFMQIGWFSVGCGIFLVLLSPFLRKWMHGVK